MAIVADASWNNPTDKSFCTHNRTNAGDPNTALTPQYVGEKVLDTTNNVRWKAVGTTSSDWVLDTPDLGA